VDRRLVSLLLSGVVDQVEVSSLSYCLEEHGLDLVPTVRLVKLFLGSRQH
jgi:predicted solute-binding protein